MHSLVHSPTQTTLKSKWHSFKTWFTPDLNNKRRPSQCSTSTTSTTSTMMSWCRNKENNLLYTKRSSLNGSEGGLLFFKRRPSNASTSSATTNMIQKEIEKIYSLYNLAIDELNYAEDSQGSPYYSGDLIAAKEAIDDCQEAYSILLRDYNEEYQLQSTIGLNISTLLTKYQSLPLQPENPLDF